MVSVLQPCEFNYSRRKPIGAELCSVAFAGVEVEVSQDRVEYDGVVLLQVLGVEFNLGSRIDFGFGCFTLEICVEFGFRHVAEFIFVSKCGKETGIFHDDYLSFLSIVNLELYIP